MKPRPLRLKLPPLKSDDDYSPTVKEKKRLESARRKEFLEQQHENDMKEGITESGKAFR